MRILVVYETWNKKFSSKNLQLPKTFFLKMAPRNQEKKAAEELVSRDMETPLAENNCEENLRAGPRKSPPRMQFENPVELMADHSKILAENQKEMLKLIAPVTKTRDTHLDIEDLDSENETPVTLQHTYNTLQPLLHQLKPSTRKNTPIFIRNIMLCS